MLKKNAPWLLVLVLLSLASLACATVMGGSRTDSLEATASAAETQINATAAAAEATARAVQGGGDDNGGDDNGGDDSGNGGDDNGGQSGGDYEFAARGPDGIPLFAAERDVNVTIADSTNLIYDLDAEVDAVADFYRAAMVDLGWTLAPSGDLEAFGTVTLTYTRAGKTAIIIITAFIGPTTVTATVT
jgi:hypothetical protein